MIRVKLSGQLEDYTGGKRELQIGNADDVLTMVKELEKAYPGVGQRILNDQELIRPYVNVFINSLNARDAKGEKTPLKDGDVVHILPSVAGG